VCASSQRRRRGAMSVGHCRGKSYVHLGVRSCLRFLRGRLRPLAARNVCSGFPRQGHRWPAKNRRGEYVSGVRRKVPGYNLDIRGDFRVWVGQWKYLIRLTPSFAGIPSHFAPSLRQKPATKPGLGSVCWREWCGGSPTCRLESASPPAHYSPLVFPGGPPGVLAFRRSWTSSRTFNAHSFKRRDPVPRRGGTVGPTTASRILGAGARQLCRSCRNDTAENTVRSFRAPASPTLIATLSRAAAESRQCSNAKEDKEGLISLILFACIIY
jgi:hypothetical protein